MKGVALWLAGTLVAFLAMANAFLLLANLGSGPVTSDPIPRAEPSDPQSPKPTLALELPEDRLEGLEWGPGQKLTLDVENGGDEELPSVDLALDVLSENTALPRARHYQATIEELAPGDVATVEFEIDLSPSIPAKSREVGPDAEPQENRKILEARATTPGGDSAVKTAVLPP